MEDKLKKFVQEHRQEFEFDEAPDFVWQEIENELKKQDKSWSIGSNKFQFIKVGLRIAAVFVLFFFLTGVWKQSHTNSDALFAQKYPELIEAKQHYEAMIEVKMVKVKSYEKSNNLSGEEMLSGEMIELKEIYQELKGELKGNIENEKIINAMIQNYRMRLEILETLLEQLNSLKKDANSSKDNEKYIL